MMGIKHTNKRAPGYQRERSERQIERILECIKVAPKISVVIAAELALGRCSIDLYMRKMHKEGRVHIASHERRHSGRPAPVWAIGQRKDAEYVPNRSPSPVRTFADRLFQVRLLLKAGHTSRELGEKLCVTRSRAQKYVQTIRDSAKPGKKTIYISGWRHPGHRGDLAPIYRIGNKPDEPKPKETRAQRYARDKADEEKYERQLARGRLRHRVASLRKKPQGVFAALGL